MRSQISNLTNQLSETAATSVQRRRPTELFCPHKRNRWRPWLSTYRSRFLPRWNIVKNAPGKIAIFGERRHSVWSARCRRGSGTTCTRSWRWRRPTSPASQCLKTSTGSHTLYNTSHVWLTTLEAGCEFMQPHVLLNLSFLVLFLFYFLIVWFFPQGSRNCDFPNSASAQS